MLFISVEDVPKPQFLGNVSFVEILIQNVPSTQKLVFKSRWSDPNGWYMPIHNTEIIRNKNS